MSGRVIMRSICCVMVLMAFTIETPAGKPLEEEPTVRDTRSRQTEPIIAQLRSDHFLSDRYSPEANQKLRLAEIVNLLQRVGRK